MAVVSNERTLAERDWNQILLTAARHWPRHEKGPILAPLNSVASNRKEVMSNARLYSDGGFRQDDHGLPQLPLVPRDGHPLFPDFDAECEARIEAICAPYRSKEVDTDY